MVMRQNVLDLLGNNLETVLLSETKR